MPTFVILATTDSKLADSWERQVGPGRVVLRLEPEGAPLPKTPGLAAVVVLDAVSEFVLPSSFSNSPTIYVGEPRTLPFEEARMAKRAKVFLSYEESTTRLHELLPILEDVAEKQCMVQLLTDKTRRHEPTRILQ